MKTEDEPNFLCFLFQRKIKWLNYFCCFFLVQKKKKRRQSTFFAVFELFRFSWNKVGKNKPGNNHEINQSLIA